jgi:Ca-activated chloride channel family protein
MRTQCKSAWFSGLLGAVLAILGYCPLLAQNDTAEWSHIPHSLGESTNPGTKLRKDVDLVLVNVTVLDSAQRVLTGLRKEDFHILDNQKKQWIRYFSTEDVPISLTVVLDASGSMETKLPKAIEAASRLLELASPSDECRLLIVRGTPGNYISLEDLDDAHRVLDTLQSKGYTALWDSIYLAANDLEKHAQYPRKAMVVISDGGDNRSRYTEKELQKLLVETDVQVYVIGLYNPFSRLPEERSGPTSLDELAKITGGHMYTAMDRENLITSVENINWELRSQYVLGYMPDPLQHDGRWRKLRVTVRRAAGMPKLHVYARKGYYAPGD